MQTGVSLFMLHRLLSVAFLLQAASAAASPMPSLVVPALELADGKQPAVKESTVKLADVSGKKPFVLLYWNPLVKGSVDELVRFDKMVRERRKHKVQDPMAFFTATRVVDEDERAAAEHVILENRIGVPVLVDRNLGIAAAIDAQFLPAYYGETREGVVALAAFGSIEERIPIYGTLGIALRTAGDDLPELLKPKPAKLAVGSRAPDFSLVDLDGRRVKLADQLGKGKNTLIIFWSVYCPHCQRELPRIQKFLKERGAVYNVVSITRMLNPKDFTDTRDFAARHGFGFPVLNDGGQVMLEYQIPGFPTWMVLDPKGTVLTIQSGEKSGLEGLLREFEK